MMTTSFPIYENLFRNPKKRKEEASYKLKVQVKLKIKVKMMIKRVQTQNEFAYLFNLNNNEINDLFKKITRERLHTEINIYNIPSLIAYELINSPYYNSMSSHQKEREHEKILGFSISKEYAKINLVEF